MKKSADEIVRDMELAFHFGTSNQVAIVYNGYCPKCFHLLSWDTERSSRRRNYRCMNTKCTFTAMFPRGLLKHLKENPNDLPEVRIPSL